MAREKVLYGATRRAAVAAASKTIADEALSLNVVDYEVLPHVIDVDEAMKPDAPLLFEDMMTRGVENPKAPSNIAKRNEFNLGDIAAGFAAADEVVEMSFKTAAVHQAYIEPQGCVARFDADGQAELWSSSQGTSWCAYTAIAQHEGRRPARLSSRDRRLRRQDRGLCRAGRRPAGTQVRRPVKVVMSREDVFRATGPTSGRR